MNKAKKEKISKQIDEILEETRKARALCKPFFNPEHLDGLDQGEISDLFEVIHDRIDLVENALENLQI